MRVCVCERERERERERNTLALMIRTFFHELPPYLTIIKSLFKHSMIYIQTENIWIRKFSIRKYYNKDLLQVKSSSLRTSLCHQGSE